MRRVGRGSHEPHGDAREPDRRRSEEAALEDQEPLIKPTEEEHALLEMVRPNVPVVRAMIDEGLISPDGRPGAPRPGHDGDDHEIGEE